MQAVVIAGARLKSFGGPVTRAAEFVDRFEGRLAREKVFRVANTSYCRMALDSPAIGHRALSGERHRGYSVFDAVGDICECERLGMEGFEEVLLAREKNRFRVGVLLYIASYVAFP